jgi:predicted Zn-dependent protease
MEMKQRESVFRSAVGDYTGGRHSQAAAKFLRLIKDGSNDPRHLSFCGLLEATLNGKTEEGLKLCERALDLGFTDPRVHLNLARVHCSLGRVNSAVAVLRNGIRMLPGHPGLLREIQRLSPRSKPPLGFLNRGHALNKYLGSVFHRRRANTGALTRI